MKRSPPIIISYYTENTPYEREAKALLASCEQFGLAHYIRPIPSLGSWAKNCCFKPYFIRQALHELKQPVLWVDSDATIVHKPCWNLFHSCDLAIFFLEKHEMHYNRFFAGTIYCGYSQVISLFLQEWDYTSQTMLKAYPDLWDQASLFYTITEEWKKKLSILPLPESYAMNMEIRLKHAQKVCYILHSQASRTYKQLVDSGNPLPGFMENLSIEDLKLSRLHPQFRAFADKLRSSIKTEKQSS